MSFIVSGSVAAAGVGAEIYGGIQASNAASRAAKAQQQQAAASARYMQQQKEQAAGMAANPAAIAAHQSAIASQSANVARQNNLVQSLDPNIIEAGKQTSALLQGKSAPVLAELQNQRAVQKQQMMSQLTQQMGPGAATSTAGQQAMQKFDLDTANMMNQAQQSYLDKVTNISMGGAKTLGESLTSVNDALSSMSVNSPEAHAANIMAGFAGAEGTAQAAKVNAAGGQFKGQQLMGQMIGQVGGQLAQGAAFAAGNEASKATAPGTTTTPGTTTPTPGAAPLNETQMSQATGDNYAFGGKAPMAAAAPGTLASTVSAPAGAGMPGTNFGGGLNYGGNVAESGGYVPLKFQPYNMPGYDNAPGALSFGAGPATTGSGY